MSCPFSEEHWLSPIVIKEYYYLLIELILMGQDTKAKSTINIFKKVSSPMGIPRHATHNCDPLLSSSEFKQFTESYCFVTPTSRPRTPKQMEKLRSRWTLLSIYQLRATLWGLDGVYTPTALTGFSPAKLMMGQKIRTRLPTTVHHLEPEWPSQYVVHESDEAHKSCTKH